MIDYRKLGLKIGLEIHQRLNTRKLFCSCSSSQKEEPIFRMTRRLHPVVGETGTTDAAAHYESLRGRTFVYQVSRNESCLVEADEEPPHGINQDAMKAALQICKLLDAEIVDEIHVMRKTVIDGSNTSGFQRTAVIGMDGKIHLKDGVINIPLVALEEEAARIEKAEGKTIAYKLSGLGIPLVEISTSPDISTPLQAREAAEKIGMLLRSCNVQRGIGSIRQDINISIASGARTELKGFQDLKEIEKAVENEVARQISLLDIKNELRGRGFKSTLMYHDTTELFRQSHNQMIKKKVDEGDHVYAMHVPYFSGLMKREVGDRTLAKEIIGYLMPFGIGGFIHTDEDVKKYGLVTEFDKLKAMFNADSNGLILILSAHPKLAEKAMHVLMERIVYCGIGVPGETRAADGIGSRYLRPLPGPARMYPETDVPAFIVTEQYLRSIEKPRTLESIQKDLSNELPEDMARQIAKSAYYKLFEKIRLSTSIEPVIIASSFLSVMKDLARKGVDVGRVSDYEIERLFMYIDKGEISKDSIPIALEKMAQGKNAEDILDAMKPFSEDDVIAIVRKAVDHNSGAKEAAIMGMVMAEVRGRYSGAEVMKIIRKEMK